MQNDYKDIQNNCYINNTHNKVQIDYEEMQNNQKQKQYDDKRGPVTDRCDAT